MKRISSALFLTVCFCGFALANDVQSRITYQDERSSVWFPHEKRVGTYVYSEAEDVCRLVTEFGSLTEFKKELRRAWTSENSKERDFALVFARVNMRLLRFTDEELQILQEIVRNSENASRFEALRCLDEAHRKAFIPFFREIAMDEPPFLASRALYALGNLADELSEDDIRFLVQKLQDSRSVASLSPPHNLVTYPVGIAALESLCEVGARAGFVRDELEKSLIDSRILEEYGYDEEKFVRFVQNIARSNLTSEQFCNFFDETGFRPMFLSSWGSFPAQDQVFSSKKEVISEELPKNLLLSVGLMRKLAPDDNRWRFLMLMSIVSPTLESGENAWIILPENFCNLAGIREFRPLWTLCMTREPIPFEIVILRNGNYSRNLFSIIFALKCRRRTVSPGRRTS